jgi:hypothetical protein
MVRLSVFRYPGELAFALLACLAFLVFVSFLDVR